MVVAAAKAIGLPDSVHKRYADERKQAKELQQCLIEVLKMRDDAIREADWVELASRAKQK